MQGREGEGGGELFGAAKGQTGRKGQPQDRRSVYVRQVRLSDIALLASIYDPTSWDCRIPTSRPAPGL